MEETHWFEFEQTQHLVWILDLQWHPITLKPFRIQLVWLFDVSIIPPSGIFKLFYHKEGEIRAVSYINDWNCISPLVVWNSSIIVFYSFLTYHFVRFSIISVYFWSQIKGGRNSYRIVVFPNYADSRVILVTCFDDQFPGTMSSKVLYSFHLEFAECLVHCRYTKWNNVNC